MTPAVLAALLLAALTVGGLLVALLAGKVTGLSRYRKTVVSAAGLTVTYLLSEYDAEPWVQKYLVPAAALGTVLGVFRVPNDAPEGQPADPQVSERDQP